MAHGIQPRGLSGIDGVLFAPLLHANFIDVTANSIPLILLGTFVLAGGVRRTLWSTGLIACRRPGWGVDPRDLLFVEPSRAGVTTVHVGASGVVFGYLGLLLTRGIVERSWWNAAVAALVGVLYGWQLQGVLPGQRDLLGGSPVRLHRWGAPAAVIFRRRRPRRTPRLTIPDSLPPDFTCRGRPAGRRRESGWRTT